MRDRFVNHGVELVFAHALRSGVGAAVPRDRIRAAQCLMTSFFRGYRAGGQHTDDDLLILFEMPAEHGLIYLPFSGCDFPDAADDGIHIVSNTSIVDLQARNADRLTSGTVSQRVRLPARNADICVGERCLVVWYFPTATWACHGRLAPQCSSRASPRPGVASPDFSCWLGPQVSARTQNTVKMISSRSATWAHFSEVVTFNVQLVPAISLIKGSAVDQENPYASPRFDIPAGQRPIIADSGAPDGPRLARSGNLLVFERGALFPARCVICNQPTESRLRKRIEWCHPAVLLLVLCNLIVLLVVYLVIRKTADVDLGMCDAHLRRRRQRLWIGWSAAILGIVLIFGSIFAAVLLEDQFADPDTVAILVVVCWLASLVLLITGAFFTTGANGFQIKRIDKRYIRLRKISPEFLATLPELALIE